MMKTSGAVLGLFALVAFLVSADAAAPSMDTCSRTMVDSFKARPKDFAGKLLACQIRGRADEECCSMTKSVFAEGGIMDKCLCEPRFFSMVLDTVPNAGFMPEYVLDMWKKCEIPVPHSEQCPGGDAAPVVTGHSILSKALKAKMLLAKAITKPHVVGSFLSGLAGGEEAAPQASPETQTQTQTEQHSGSHQYVVVGHVVDDAHVTVVETPQPQPAADPQPQPAANPQPQPAADPQPQPAADPQPQPAADPQPQPAQVPAPAAVPVEAPIDFPMPSPVEAPPVVPVEPKVTGGVQDVPEPAAPLPPVAPPDAPAPAFLPPPGEAKLTGGSKIQPDVVAETTDGQVPQQAVDGANTDGQGAGDAWAAAGGQGDATAWAAADGQGDAAAGGAVDGQGDAAAWGAAEAATSADVQGAVQGRRLRFI